GLRRRALHAGLPAGGLEPETAGDVAQVVVGDALELARCARREPSGMTERATIFVVPSWWYSIFGSSIVSARLVAVACRGGLRAAARSAPLAIGIDRPG